MNKTEHDELCCTYAALLLHDDGLEVSAEKLNQVIKATGNEVESYWPGLFAKALVGQDISALLTKVSAGAAGGASRVVADAGAPAETEVKKEEEPEEEVDMGGLFGGDDDGY